jgi:hypothetical protein
LQATLVYETLNFMSGYAGSCKALLRKAAIIVAAVSALAPAGAAAGGVDSLRASAADACVAPSKLGVAVVLDDSGSMSYNDARDLRGTAGGIGLDQLPDDSLVAASVFTSSARRVFAPTSITASNRESLKDSIVSALRSSGGTDYGSAFREATSQLGLMSAADRKAVVFLSDGEPNDTNFTDDLPIARAGVPIFTVGFASAPGDVLSGIAARSGGQSFTVESAGEAQAVFARIIARLTCDSQSVTDQVTLPPGASRDVQFAVAADDKEFRALAAWADSGSVEMRVVRPNGTELGPGTEIAGERFVQDASYALGNGVDPSPGGWKVRLTASASNVASVDVSIDVWKRTGFDPPSPPQLDSPADGAAVADPANVTFKWQPARVGDQGGYKLIIDGAERASTGPNDTEATALVAAGSHEWFVEARNAFGSTPSARRKLTVVVKDWARTPTAASADAQRFAPYVRQDSSEQWDVLDVDKYFEAILAGKGLGPDPFSGDKASDQIPWTSVRAQSDATPKAYVREYPNPELRFDWFNYWWYQSFNDGRGYNPSVGDGSTPGDSCATGQGVTVECLDHWSDWEGVAIGRSKGEPDKSKFTVARFRGHGNNPRRYNYLRDVLQCGVPQRPCGRGASDSRVNVYQSNGQHASYPKACKRLCFQGGFPSLPETRHDGGKRPFLFKDAANDVKNLPERDWMEISGDWGPPGTEAIPRPGGNPGSRWELDTPWAKPSNKTSAKAAAAESMSDCDSWFGANIQASVCNEAQLSRALEDGSLWKSSDVKVSSPGLEASGLGVTQSAGDPLKLGQKLVIAGEALKGSQLRVTSSVKGFEFTDRFDRLGLEDGKGSVTVTAVAGAGLVAKNEKGNKLKPAVSVKTDLRVLAAPRLKSAKKTGGTLTVVFRKPTKGRFQVTVQDSKRKSILTKVLTLRAGKAKIVMTAAVAKAAANVSFAQLNGSGFAGRPVTIKIKR